MRVIWGEFPPGLREHVEVHLDPYLQRLPSWLETLKVVYNEDDVEDYCTLVTQFHYREARLDVTPLYWGLSRIEREQTLVHELGHAIQAPADAVVARIIARLPADLQAWAEEDYENACEGVVSDLAYIATRG